MSKPANTPNWNSSHTEEPSEQLRTDGWQDNEKPKASHFNWLFNNISEWLLHLKDAPAPDATGTITIPNPTKINVDSEQDGLLVNQTGTGAAIRVEDSGNPDSTPFIVDSEGRVGIGTDAPSYKLEIESEDTKLA